MVAVRLGGDVTAPSDITAEQHVLGALMLAPKLCDAVFGRITTGDFYRPAHQVIATAIHARHLKREPIDATLIATDLLKAGEINRCGGHAYIADLIHAVPVAANATWYAAIVAEQAQRRALCEAAARIDQLATDPGTDVAATVQSASDAVEAIRTRHLYAEDLTSPTLAEFLDADTGDPDWVIPGLLEHYDRLLFVGPEGAGKSMLARQIGICAAAGLHPFGHRPMPASRVLLVDCENPPSLMRRKMRPIVAAVRQLGADVPDGRMFVETRPEGLDLTKPRDATWLLKLAATTIPDLLIIGPLYKLHVGNPNDEEPARAVSACLDMIRARTRTAIITEAHAPQASGDQRRNWRPYGSSLWLRWPEFGYAMAPTDSPSVVNFQSFRGDRDERYWPERLTRGGPMPWNETTPI